MRQEPITFCCVSKPHLDKLKELVPLVLPYVDRVVIVIGEDDQETKDFLSSLGEKVECHYYPWEDNFAKQWNNYLNHISYGWILILDDDESPSKEMLESLDQFVEQSHYGERFCFVEFRCHNISEGQLADHPAEYWRQLLFRYNPMMKYMGGTVTGCHQYVAGHQNNRGVRSDLIYYHSKTFKEEHQHSFRNWWTYGVWPHGSREGLMGPEWQELRNTIKRCHPEAEHFPEFDRIMIEGSLHDEVKTLMVKQYNEFRDHPDYNELRGAVKYFFDILHPEEAEKFGFVK